MARSPGLRQVGARGSAGREGASGGGRGTAFTGGGMARAVCWVARGPQEPPSCLASLGAWLGPGMELQRHRGRPAQKPDSHARPRALGSVPQRAAPTLRRVGVRGAISTNKRL